MGAKWETISPRLKDCILNSMLSQGEVGDLCLACSVYALGLMGATWEGLPEQLKAQMTASSEKLVLQDQMYSNVIYGLSLLGVNWDSLDPMFKNSLLRADDSTFSQNVPQHISNTIWVIRHSIFYVLNNKL
jgi:hypothetical protein